MVLSDNRIHFVWFDRRNAGLTDADVEIKLDEAITLIGLPVKPAPPRDPSVYYLPEFHERIRRKIGTIQEAAPAWVQKGGDPALLEAILKEVERRLEKWTHGWEIYYKQSIDGELTWSADTRLTKARSVSARPSLVFNNSHLHMVWYDSRNGNIEVYYKHSADHGMTWGKDVRLTRAKNDSLHPMIAISPNSLHVVWYDERDRNSEIYYKYKRN